VSISLAPFNTLYSPPSTSIFIKSIFWFLGITESNVFNDTVNSSTSGFSTLYSLFNIPLYAGAFFTY
jgi:hypothetical protein